MKTKVYVVSLVLSVVSKNVFGIFLALLVWLKSVKLDMFRKFQVRSQGILCSLALKRLIGEKFS
jgi:hypothetical protein